MHFMTVKLKNLNIDIPVTALSLIHFFKQNSNKTNGGRFEFGPFLSALEEIKCLFMFHTVSPPGLKSYFNETERSFISSQCFHVEDFFVCDVSNSPLDSHVFHAERSSAGI